MSFLVTVPASTANLGSGFDALGLALGLYDEVEVRVADELSIEVTGEGSTGVPLDESHLVVRAIRAAGYLGGLSLTCRNSIPHARGLGSSAAAIVAGVAAGYALVGRELDTDALQIAAEFEGHADNAAASLMGGVVVAWSEGERFRAVRKDPHPDLRPVVLVPSVESSTKTTRGLLPAEVPHGDAAFAAGRAALAVHALTTDPSVLLAATEDRLHQQYREPAWPDTVRVINDLRKLGVPAAVSGAGPTVLAFGDVPAEVDVHGFDVRRLDVDTSGVRVRPLG
ncbi:homoserine kinase [Lentzea sp. NBRC 105346]|uniref:homoserine kinase n=1 Tax=Lentzea sp. NBRC 105346 TaxID=3032205 RepID=UPI0024A1C7B5|nr:homoserine kinase [Lentzea sp. NBRC 105346]GLZ30181.1 homoserine kinase [Lentzea sp. NBRC 105346]